MRLTLFIITILFISGCSTVYVTSDPSGAIAQKAYYDEHGMGMYYYSKKSKTPAEFTCLLNHCGYYMIIWDDGTESEWRKGEKRMHFVRIDREDSKQVKTEEASSMTTENYSMNQNDRRIQRSHEPATSNESWYEEVIGRGN